MSPIRPKLVASLAVAVAVAVAVSVSLSCSQTVHQSYSEYGAELARSPTLANNSYNVFACTTCHAERVRNAGAQIYPGAVLEGAAARPAWWGGNVRDLHAAVETCLQGFMQGERLDPHGEKGQALATYLQDLAIAAAPGQTAAVSFTLPPTAHDLELGDAARGTELYTRACAYCHGAKHTGTGRLGPLVSILPEDTLNAHLQEYGPACTRVTFIEKVRHGRFLGFAGRMPPFSEEVLSDTQLADILAYLEAPVGGTCTP